MANDNKPEIVLDGDISPFRRKLREAGEDLKKFGKEGEASVSNMLGPLSGIQSKFVAIGALLAGGAVFKEAVKETALFTEESTKLARAMGITAGEASVLRETLIQGNTSQEEFVGAAKGLGKQIRENEAGLNAMGLKTRDAAGHLRPLVDLTFDAIKVVNGYKEGTDRAIAGQVVFGKSFEMTTNLAMLNHQALKETEAQMVSLGVVASEESVAAWQAFDDSGDRATLTLKALMLTVGNAVMPVLTKLGDWFTTIGPAAVVVLKGSIGALISILWGLKFSVEVVWNYFALFIEGTVDTLMRFGTVAARALVFDFAGAKAAWETGGKILEETIDARLKNIMDSAEETRDKLWNLFAEGTPTVKPPGGGKDAGGLIKGKEKKETESKAPESVMDFYDAVLAQRKNAYEQENVLRQFSKEQELAYWRELQAGAALSSKDSMTIAKRTALLELDIRRKSAKDQQDLDAVSIDRRRALSLDQLAIDEQGARFARENGNINQRELIALEEGFARRRFEIEYQSLIERMDLARDDPTQSPAARARLNEELLDLERQYQLRKNQLGQEMQVENGKFGAVFEDMGSAFGNSANAILSRATTMREQLGNIFGAIYQSFLHNLVSAPMGAWIASQTRLMAVKLGFVQADQAANAAGAASTVAIKTAETTAVVGANAVQAGTGAAASQAPIPIIGPGLAIAAMAAMFAAVMAMGKMKSAARGFDIPKGLNPITQLHEEEMVLPKQYANIIRGLTGNGDGATTDNGTAPPQHITIHAMDASSVRDYFKRNSHTLAPGLRTLARHFTPTRGG